MSLKFFIFLVLGLAATAYAVYAFSGFLQYKSIMPVVCSQEVKLCPDGSTYVGRQGPKCEFAACPEPATATIYGRVAVGPICPVENVDRPCPVSSEAYTTREVLLFASNGSTLVKRMHFNADGTYNFTVLAGTYVVNIPTQAIGGSSDLPKTISVAANQSVEFNFSIDTGIR